MFVDYRRTGLTQARPVTEDEVAEKSTLILNGVSISEADIANGSPKMGDMIARNVNNHDDQWLIAKEYFEANLELVKKRAKPVPKIIFGRIGGFELLKDGTKLETLNADCRGIQEFLDDWGISYDPAITCPHELAGSIESAWEEKFDEGGGSGWITYA